MDYVHHVNLLSQYPNEGSEPYAAAPTGARQRRANIGGPLRTCNNVPYPSSVETASPRLNYEIRTGGISHFDNGLHEPPRDCARAGLAGGTMGGTRLTPSPGTSNAVPKQLNKQQQRFPPDAHVESKSKSSYLFNSNSYKPNGKQHSEHPTDSTDKVKTKLLSMWNNVKYGWTVKVKTNFSKDSPIWLLGKCYHNPSSSSQEKETEQSFPEFRLDFYSRIWLTYRREFPSLAGSSLTTDCGWGCMLRSGQMMLAEAFSHHFLGRDWQWKLPQSTRDRDFHHNIVRWFGDMQSDVSPFSLHNLVKLGESSGKKAGDWYGPASVAHILRQAMENASGFHPLLKELCIYVAQDCTVYKQDVFDLCIPETSGAQKQSAWKGVIILIPVRLGGEAFNTIYVNCIQEILSYRNCIGIIGGRPRHSLYFIGWQAEKLIHLDPHYCQEVVDVTEKYFDLETFHCSSPRKMSFMHMDPSCTIGFYCESMEEFHTFVKLSEAIVLKNSRHSDYPVFIVAEGRGEDCSLQHRLPYQDDLMSSWRMRSDNSFDSDDEAEEFVVI